MDMARGLAGLDDPGRFGPWAYRIVTRRCALWIRRQQRRRAVECEAAAVRSSTSDAQAELETTDAIRVALRRLPEDQQAILEMRLQRLTGLERDKIIEEYKTILAFIEELKLLLGSESLVFEVIKKELDLLRGKLEKLERVLKPLALGKST